MRIAYLAFGISLFAFPLILPVIFTTRSFHSLEAQRAQREFNFCPIGRRRSGKRSQPGGHDLLTRWLDVNGWSQAKELSPEAEALFPGRRLPAREKTPSSVSSVPLW